MNALAGIAVQQVKAYLDSRIRTKFPNGKATMAEISGEVGAICEHFGYAGAITVEKPREEDGPVTFVLSDPLQTMMLAAAIHAEE